MRSLFMATAVVAFSVLGVAGPATAAPPSGDNPPGNSGEHRQDGENRPPHSGGPGTPATPPVDPPRPEHAGPPAAPPGNANGHDNAPGAPGPGGPGPSDPGPSDPGQGAPDDKPGNPTPGELYPLCHATGSESHPYEFIEIALPGIINGHDGHGDDIIPPVPGHFEGLNWDEAGQAIFDAGCVVAETGPTDPTEPDTAEPGLPTSPLPEDTTPPASSSDEEPALVLPIGAGLALTGAQLSTVTIAVIVLLLLGGIAAVLWARRRAQQS